MDETVQQIAWIRPHENLDWINGCLAKGAGVYSSDVLDGAVLLILEGPKSAFADEAAEVAE